jgi:hypothetical protein
MNATFDFRLVTCSIQVAIDTVGVTANLLIVCLYLTRTRLRAINGFHLMFILALADVFVCAGDMILASRRLIQYALNIDQSLPIKRYWVMLLCMPNFTGIQVAQITTCAITLERIRALVYPNLYRNSRHKRNAYIIGSVATVYGVVALLITNFMAQNFYVRYLF